MCCSRLICGSQRMCAYDCTERRPLHRDSEFNTHRSRQCEVGHGLTDPDSQRAYVCLDTYISRQGRKGAWACSREVEAKCENVTTKGPRHRARHKSKERQTRRKRPTADLMRKKMTKTDLQNAHDVLKGISIMLPLAILLCKKFSGSLKLESSSQRGPRFRIDRSTLPNFQGSTCKRHVRVDPCGHCSEYRC